MDRNIERKTNWVLVCRKQIQVNSRKFSISFNKYSDVEKGSWKLLSDTTAATCGAHTVDPSGASEFILVLFFPWTILFSRVVLAYLYCFTFVFVLCGLNLDSQSSSAALTTSIKLQYILCTILIKQVCFIVLRECLVHKSVKVH